MPDGIVAQIACKPLLHPLWKFVPSANGQRKCELGPVRERQQLPPILVGDIVKIGRPITGEAETADDCQEVRPHSMAPYDQRPQNALGRIHVVITQTNCGQSHK